MQPKGTKPIEACPNCGADSQYRIWEKVKGVHGPISVASDVHQIIGSPITALVCKRCGYVQLFVSPQDFYKS